MKYLIVRDRYHYQVVALEKLVATWEKARNGFKKWTGKPSKVRYKLSGVSRVFSTRVDVFPWLVKESTEEEHKIIQDKYDEVRKAHYAYEVLNKDYDELIRKTFDNARPVQKSEVTFEAPK